MKKLLLFAFISFLNFDLSAQVTYADDIASIIYTSCSNCHREGEIGPFPLTNYEEVKQRANMIKFVTESSFMPPWQADPGYSRFLEENFLNESEIQKIAQWIEDGTPRGDIAHEPPFPDFPSGSALGTPDLVLEMEESHLHRGNNRDSYYYFVLPNPLTEDKVVKAVEFRPGNSKIVHHALIFEDRNGIAANTDAQTSEYGFPSFGSFNGNENDFGFLEEKQFPPYAPGQKALRYPDGLGQILKAGSDIAVQIHYAPSSIDEFDQSSINFFFADETEEVTRFVDNDIMLPFNLPGGFFAFSIPPNQEKTFVGRWNVTSDLSLLGIFPHSHLLGKEWEAWIEHTDGSTTNLISIPEWDFNWQSTYFFNQFLIAEKGSKIFARAVYDNTTNNPNNPNNPPRNISWGDRTEDEMYYMPFLFVPYESGDEDILFNDITSTNNNVFHHGENQLLPLSPNPVQGNTLIQFHLAKGGPLNIAIIDIQGQLVRQLRKGEFFNSGLSQIQFDAESLSSGTYFVVLQGKDIQLAQKFNYVR
ncbi:MAG: T9SS type A sorting domain-containing protein [Saprospiraceae bacterium]|nr:T9SS type A sorting domain-containing protein [Saprospiraceae bacterium]